MNETLLKLKLTRFRNHYGEMTYDDCIAVATHHGEILEGMNVMDSAWGHFKEQQRHHWEYAELLNIQGNLERTDHFTVKEFLVAWWQYSPRVKPHQRTELVQVVIPHSVASYQLHSVVEKAIVEQFDACLSPLHKSEVIDVLTGNIVY